MVWVSWSSMETRRRSSNALEKQGRIVALPTPSNAAGKCRKAVYRFAQRFPIRGAPTELGSSRGALPCSLLAPSERLIPYCAAHLCAIGAIPLLRELSHNSLPFDRRRMPVQLPFQPEQHV